MSNQKRNDVLGNSRPAVLSQGLNLQQALDMAEYDVYEQECYKAEIFGYYKVGEYE